MINNEKVTKILYGGDYNPEQWSEDIWKEDMRIFHLAGIDTVTLNVFSWAKLQPSEECYNWEQLDKIMNLVRDNGLNVCLATSTAAHPAWMAKRYPEVLRTEFSGMKRKFGGRHNSCPNSLVYRKYAGRLAGRLAERYRDYDNIVGWHVSNEFGGECFCENCEKEFRVWLKKKYGTIEEVNRVWNTSFWGHTFYDFDEIVLPNCLSEHFAYEKTMFQGISLDYRRFSSDSMLECFKLEYDEIKKWTPDIPITSNLMGFYKPLDYQKWAKSMDFVSWDSYPSNDTPIAQVALSHDLMRGIKQGKPFALMEQTPSVQNWQQYNAIKRPKVMRLWSYQAVAHGADTVLFFQLRRSIGACEKMHGAVIDHVGNENTRVFREVAELGKELIGIGNEIIGARTKAEVAIVMDWDNWWAVEYSAGPTSLLNYIEEIRQYYTPLYHNNVPVDIIGVDDELSQYKLVIAPLLYMTKGEYDKKITKFVQNGGTFLTTYFSGIVEEHDLVVLGGYPGKLRKLMGIWVEEMDALPEGKENTFTYEGEVYPAKILCDLLHLEGAESLASYEKEFYQGMPVLTKNKVGEGTAYYVATRANEGFYEKFLKDICMECNIVPVMSAPEQVEVTKRVRDNGTSYLFILNHSEEEKTVELVEGGKDLISNRIYRKEEQLVLEAKGVAILKIEDRK